MTTDPAVDLAERFRPSPHQLTIAEAMLRGTGLAVVYVPIALPGKQEGLWDVGQPVQYPLGFFPAYNRGEGGRAARNAASQAAEQHLRATGQDGMTAYAVISRGGVSWAVWEDHQYVHLVATS
jgi:hypothetical protein